MPAPAPLAALAPMAAVGSLGSIGGMAVNIVGDTKGFQAAIKQTEKIAKLGGKQTATAFQEISNAVEKSKMAVGGLVGAVEGMFSSFFGPSEAMRGIIGAMNDLWGAMGDQITGALMPAIMPFIDALVKINTEVVPILLPAITDLATEFGEEFGPILEEDVIPFLKDMAKIFVEDLAPIIKDIIPDVAELVSDVIDLADELELVPIATGLAQIGLVAFKLIVKGVDDTVQDFVNTIRSLKEALWAIPGLGGGPIGGGAFGIGVRIGIGMDPLRGFFDLMNSIR